MNESLIKAYDIIKEEQRNADNKAYIFILLLSAILTFFNKINIGYVSQEEVEGLMVIYIITIFVLLLLIVSLIPIYKNTYSRFKKKKENIDFNIFYWRSISNLENEVELFNEYTEKYKDNKELTIEEKHLLNQIKVNAEILESKSYLHKRAFFIIGQMILLFLVSVITYYTFKDSIIAALIYLVFFETVYLVGIFKRPTAIYNLLSKL